ncbi:hypothetical protein [Streptomyces radicis]|uniref:Uncharacterized protein n=1 Tax=Streptomyces radicis TaxID=1750517 RepID=A0A3A9VQH9_9ACTN|nr:hypothetical protein [Streptomyces radicis]RKN03305.1 hypothetical protein D7319_31750 [Streptomyces radicis]RKN13190.1 hypothetical protein D7318_31725 [Streptomyces radicis]
MAADTIDPGEPPRAVDMILRSLPDRQPPASWCAEHPPHHAARVLRAAWICRACVREQAREP